MELLKKDTLQDVAEHVVLVWHGGAEDEGADERGHPYWGGLVCVRGGVGWELGEMDQFIGLYIYIFTHPESITTKQHTYMDQFIGIHIHIFIHQEPITHITYIHPRTYPGRRPR